MAGGSTANEPRKAASRQSRAPKIRTLGFMVSPHYPEHSSNPYFFFFFPRQCFNFGYIFGMTPAEVYYYAPKI